MMKKSLSIFLAFSLVVQPVYSVTQPVQAPKKGIITRVKEKLVSMQEVLSRGNAVLKANWQCLVSGKGEKCNPDKHLSLQIIRNFVKGDMKATREGLGKLLAKHWECWKPILIVLFGVGTVAGVAGSAWLHGYAEIIESSFEGGRPSVETAVAVGAAKGAAVAGAVVGAVAVASYLFHRKYGNKQANSVLEMEGRLKRFGKCVLVIGLDIAIVLALLLIIRKIVHQDETSKEEILRSYTRDTSASRINLPVHDNGYTLLIQAIKEKDIEKVKTLIIDKKADVNAPDKTGTTPLHHAVYSASAAVIKFLLENGAKVNAQNKSGYTPLHYVALVESDYSLPRSLAIAQILIDAGADANLFNAMGKKPYDLAKNSALKDLLKPKELPWVKSPLAEQSN